MAGRGVALYARVSTDQQARDNTIASQVAALHERIAAEALCCTGRRCGRIEPYPCSGSCDADVVRAPELEHAVQRVGRDRPLGRLAPVGLEA